MDIDEDDYNYTRQYDSDYEENFYFCVSCNNDFHYRYLTNCKICESIVCLGCIDSNSDYELCEKCLEYILSKKNTPKQIDGIMWCNCVNCDKSSLTQAMFRCNQCNEFHCQEHLYVIHREQDNRTLLLCNECNESKTDILSDSITKLNISESFVNDINHLTYKIQNL